MGSRVYVHKDTPEKKERGRSSRKSINVAINVSGTERRGGGVDGTGQQTR